MDSVDIGGRAIGGGRCFVIAEAGVNHNGNPLLARRLIDAAADAGADAVKFQTFDPDLLADRHAETAEYQKRALGEAGSQLDMLRGLVLPRAEYPALVAHARERHLTFLSTPFDNGSADFLETLGLPAFKVSSGDLTNALLLRHLSRKGKPLLIATGMANQDEVAAALETVRLAGPVPVVVLHCVSNYPTAPADCNLKAMAAMRAALGVPVGFSDHTSGSAVALAAAALGAVVIEKHLTLDRSLPGPDHQASVEPRQFLEMVAGIRDVEQSLGTSQKAAVPSETPIAAIGRRSLHWAHAMHEGDVVREEDLVALRPATGMSPERWREVVGGRLVRAVERHEQVSPGDVRR